MEPFVESLLLELTDHIVSISDIGMAHYATLRPPSAMLTPMEITSLKGEAKAFLFLPKNSPAASYLCE